MTFGLGLDNFATLIIKKLKVEVDPKPIEFPSLSPEETYKYLGLAQNKLTDHTAHNKKEFKEKNRKRSSKKKTHEALKHSSDFQKSCYSNEFMGISSSDIHLECLNIWMPT